MILNESVPTPRRFFIAGSFYNLQKKSVEETEFLRKIVSKNEPGCVYADGIHLLDDVGGIGGFIDMLKEIHGKDKEKVESMREWAYAQGWNGRLIKPESML